MTTDFTTSGIPHPQGFSEEPLFFLTRVYLTFLQGLFKQFPEGCYTWSEDDKLTEVWITDQSPFPRDRIQQRPAIITMRGPAQFANLSLDNMQSLDRITGAKRRSDLVACTMSLNCVAKNGVEAQRIAWIVFTHIRRFKALLQRHGIHKIGDAVSIGPESDPGTLITPESDTAAVLVTVQSPFFFQWTEEVTPTDRPLLNEVDLFLKARLGTVVTTKVKEKDPVFRRPTIRGRPIGESLIVVLDPTIEQEVKID